MSNTPVLDKILGSHKHGACECFRAEDYAAASSELAELRQQVQSLVAPLKEVLDRAWKDETPEQIVSIAASGIYWRNKQVQSLETQVQAWKDACGLEQPHNLKKLCDGVQSLERERAEAIEALRALTLALSGSYLFWELEHARAVLARNPQPGQQEVK